MGCKSCCLKISVSCTESFHLLYSVQHASWQYLHHTFLTLHINTGSWNGKLNQMGCDVVYTLQNFRQNSPDGFRLGFDEWTFCKWLSLFLSLRFPLPQIIQMESDLHQRYQVQTSKCLSTLMRPTPRTARSLQMTYESPLLRSRKWRNTE